MVTFVLVPGAWLGGWCWRKVAANLEGAGHVVVAATLTGLGERAHLADREVGLETHVRDVTGMVTYRDLNDVILVGHSYGGVVITAVAERIHAHIRCLVYLDGSLPQDGQSNNDVIGPEMALRLRLQAEANGGGWLVPPPSTERWGLEKAARPLVEQRLTPHPLRCFEEAIRLCSQDAASLRRVFLRSSSKSELYGQLIEQACKAGWECRDLAGGHYSMLTEPQAVAKALIQVARSSQSQQVR